MLAKFAENLSIKILSVLIAFVTWVVIMNHINPMVNGFVNVPIIIENEDYILNQNKTFTILDSRIIRVNYLVKSNEQTSIRQSDFKVYVDLKELENTDTNTVPIHYSYSNDVNVSNVSTTPEMLHIDLSDLSRDEFPVTYSIKGDLGEGHSVGSVILSPNIVYVSGSNTVLENIDHVEIEIPTNNREETFSGVATTKIYDKNGNVIDNEGLMLSANTINYYVVVFSRSTVPVNAFVEGNAKPGYSYGGVQVNPSNIIINGPRSTLQNITTLDLPTINIDELTKSTEYKYNVTELLPIDVKCNVTEISVNVIINENIHAGPRDERGPHVEGDRPSAIINSAADRNRQSQDESIEDTTDETTNETNVVVESTDVSETSE